MNQACLVLPFSRLFSRTPQVCRRERFLLTAVLPFIFVLLLSLLTCAPGPSGDSLPDLPLSPFVTFVSPQHNRDPDGKAEEGHARPLERSHSASVRSENEDSE